LFFVVVVVVAVVVKVDDRLQDDWTVIVVPSCRIDGFDEEEDGDDGVTPISELLFLFVVIVFFCRGCFLTRKNDNNDVWRTGF
jgi:hypothetical protein